MDLSDFVRCNNCGKYFEPDSQYGERCSKECSLSYFRCETCGRYFPQGEGHSKSICSAECSILYSVIKRYNQEKYVNYEKESA